MNLRFLRESRRGSLQGGQAPRSDGRADAVEVRRAAAPGQGRSRGQKIQTAALMRGHHLLSPAGLGPVPPSWGARRTATARGYPESANDVMLAHKVDCTRSRTVFTLDFSEAHLVTDI